jgi:hypothetical protein
MAEAVVLGPLLLVAEDVIGILHFLEAALGLLVAGIAVGMIFAGQLAVGLLDLVVCGVALDAQDVVVIAGHSRSPAGDSQGVRCSLLSF